MNPNCKISREQRNELVKLYVKGGFKAIAQRAAELGVTAKYIANVASFEGLRRENAGTRTDDDPRWEWAKQRGAVIV